MSPVSSTFDWIMKATTVNSRTNIQWSILSQLLDQDFADDIGLLSHKHQYAQKVRSLSSSEIMHMISAKDSFIVTVSNRLVGFSALWLVAQNRVITEPKQCDFKSCNHCSFEPIRMQESPVEWI